jgi:hypothetical protein
MAQGLLREMAGHAGFDELAEVGGPSGVTSRVAEFGEEGVQVARQNDSFLLRYRFWW